MAVLKYNEKRKKKRGQQLDKWKVTFYGEGTYWEHKNLSYERAVEILDDSPNEYLGVLEPMETEDEEK